MGEIMFEKIYNFLRLAEKLTSSGMPTVEQISDAPNHGVEVVVNLAPHDVPDALSNEAELAASLEMEYIHIPVNWNTPTKDGLDKFMDAMDARKDKTIHVHCEANFRASAFVTMYRILRLGWKDEEAFEVMHKVWDEDEFPVWKMFIDGMIKNGRENS
jgi:protein tyrosine phosphatase (PTP) superfamily phosphohydrolase (DUF442 family)